MSLFRKAGKQFEKTKQAYLDGDPEYICRACNETVDEAFDHCPHCGEPGVEPIEDIEEDG